MALPRRGRFALRFPSELCGTLLSIHSAPLLRGGKGTGFVGSPWTPENPVTRFPVENGGADGTKGGKAAVGR